LQSQCGFNREWMAITIWYQERTDNHLCVIPTEHKLPLHFDISRQPCRQHMKESLAENFLLLLMDCELDDTDRDYSLCH
jgi:hypothetical protein